MKRWVTSDHHFLHNRIIEICQRPFENIDEMNEQMVERWNSLIGKEDIVYYLGDFAIEKHNMKIAREKLSVILNALNGQKILIAGNHDEAYLNFYLDYFYDIVNYFELMVDGRRVVMCHYPFEEWRDSRRGSIHLHGHLHGGQCAKIENRYDIGADTNNFYPYLLDNFLKKKTENEEK